jgi:precorrin-3B methylase
MTAQKCGFVKNVLRALSQARKSKKQSAVSGGDFNVYNKRILSE